ncbi:beta-glucosidase BglX [Pisciglobus halotolerans]|uniref:beta-glucosidase n=1 Tax=Pisciglobus halotolerans TaxID=745365 RepID=A0A1I3AUV7_9LACT|nr:beta-glucosidase BglX [Pisciglobus halotolerans]SFH53793.1 beta-glucosidase [Pisciglobus halotolerans]
MKKEALKALFDQMTIEEKIGQTVQLAAPFFEENEQEITGPLNDMGITKESLWQAGSALGISGAEKTRKVQQDYLQHSRLGIPMLLMADVIHGFRTIFPIPLGLGATWNPELIKESAAIAAKEAAVSGLHVTFSPMVDLVRDARWGRVLESTGEDKYLNQQYARAFVEGYQGKDLKEDFSKVAACIKHFAGYGAPIAGRDYNTVEMTERTLREQYLPAYKEGIDAGAKLVMTSFNTIDGIPATGNQKLMRNLLREEMGFDGILISDWGAIGELVPHGVAEDLREAAKLAMKAGVDIEMMSPAYGKELQQVMEEDQQYAQLLDEAVWRILVLKNDLGLFEDPYRGADEAAEQAEIFNGKNREKAREIAEKAMVLLENDGTLPLKKEQKILIVGPKKDSRDLLGAWSWQGQQEETTTLMEAMSEKIRNENILSIEDETDLYNGLNSFHIAQIHEADVILVVLGESSEMSGEAASRSNIRLPENQLALLRELKKLNKKIVVTVFNGRPLDLTEVSNSANAMIEAWFPGTEGAAALVNTLYGEANPSGKLSMSFPRNVGQVPIFYNQDSTGRPLKEDAMSEKYFSRYLDVENTPLYPFGHGLSYTTFNFSKLFLSDNRLTKEDTLTVTVEVTNSGERKGVETVQLYIRDKVARVVRPVKELIGFKQVTLEPQETQAVTFTINEHQLAYTHTDYSVSSDAGEFEVMIGPNSSELQAASFSLEK